MDTSEWGWSVLALPPSKEQTRDSFTAPEIKVARICQFGCVTKSINTVRGLDRRQTKVRLDLAGMGMGLLRWLLWPRRPKYEEDEPPRRRSRSQPRRRPQSHRPGVYRIEVDGEAGRFHGDGAPFSFWSSSRIILILSFLLWWIPPAGPMIAGYVGGRRAGSPIKAVIAALMPVFAIYIANITYAHNFASHPSHRPHRARARGRPAIAVEGRHRRRDRGVHFESYRKLSADTDEYRERRSGRSRRRPDDDEDDDGDEFVATRTHRISHGREEEPREPREHRRPSHARAEREDEDEARPEPTARPTHVRSQAEERAIQKFVERALRNYDHAKL